MMLKIECAASGLVGGHAFQMKVSLPFMELEVTFDDIPSDPQVEHTDWH